MPITAVLARLGVLASLRKQAGRLIGPCPLHGGCNRTQFVVNARDGIWFCFGDCKRGGGSIALVAAL